MFVACSESECDKWIFRFGFLKVKRHVHLALLIVQEFKSRAHFSAAMRGHIASSKNKKMSRLKRIIVRERADKAVAQASQAASQAAAAAAAAKQAHADLVRDMQVAPVPANPLPDKHV